MAELISGRVDEVTAESFTRRDGGSGTAVTLFVEVRPREYREVKIYSAAVEFTRGEVVTLAVRSERGFGREPVKYFFLSRVESSAEALKLLGVDAGPVARVA